MKITIMYPCFFGNINKIDNDYEFELELAKKYDYDYVFFDHDLFVSSGKVKLNKKLNSDNFILYRGWMLTDIQYKNLFDALEKENVKMIVSPELYNNGHLFPRVYERVKYYTPKTIWFKEGETIDWKKVKDTFDKFIIKDYVKSVKGFSFPTYFDDSYSEEELNDYVNKFKEIRGDLFTGGIVFKKYVELKKTEGHTHEFRAFYINGKVVCIYPNSENYDDLVPIYEAQEINSLYSDFYTVDFAEIVDGKIIVIEAGDGQVSGIASIKEAEQIYKFLNKLVF